MKLAALFEAKKKPQPLEITPENVLANINGNWSDTMMAMGYDLDQRGAYDGPNRKKIQAILDQFVKDKKITYSSYPAEDNVYRLVK